MKKRKEKKLNAFGRKENMRFDYFPSKCIKAIIRGEKMREGCILVQNYVFFKSS